MNGFKNVDNRENILDIIYDYLDIVDDIEEYKQKHNMRKRKENNMLYSCMQDEYGKDVTGIWYITSDDGVENCCISVEGYDKPMRGRSSMICLRKVDDDYFVLCKANEDDYGVPGGGWNMEEFPKEAAIRELHEETLTDAKQVTRMGTLIEYHEEVKDWVKKHVPNPDDWWYGYYSIIFVGMYAGKFDGHVAEEDREYEHKWKPVEEVKSEFPKEYQKAIEDYLAL